MRRMLRSAAALGVAAALLGPSVAAAQGSGDGFLFKPPVGTFGVRGGFAHASANSDIFTDATDFLTLDRGDFSGLGFGVDLAFRLSSRFDLAFGASYATAEHGSEFRDWTDQDDLPIEQTTAFRRMPLGATLKAYLTPRGRSIGSFAWIPARVAPYVGVGGGAMWYRFRQEGDFVDFEDLGVFTDRIEDSGWAPMGHAVAGLDYSLGPRFLLTGETRYTYAKAEMDRTQFEGFDKIDLSGFSATIGVAVRF
jgi:hypothetical protein